MSILKRSGVYLTANILNALVPFLLLPILTRYLNTTEYGQIAMFQTLVSGLIAVTGLNTVGAANRKYYDKVDDHSLPKYIGACIHILIFSTLILLLANMLLGRELADLLNIPQNWIVYAILISAGNFIVQLRLGQWQVRERELKFATLQISQSFCLFTVTLSLLFVLRQGVFSRVNAFFIVTTIYVLISIITLYREKLLTLFSFSKSSYSDALKYGVPLIPHIVGIFFLSAVDRILINKNLGTDQAGIYMVGVQLSLGMVILFDALNKAFVPWLFKLLSENNSLKIKKVVRFTYLYFCVVGCVGVLSFWMGPIAIKLIAGEQYEEASSVIGWLCLGQAFNGMYLMVVNYIFYAKKTGRLSIITILCGVFNILLLMLLMNYWGIRGVAIAYAISMLIRFIITWVIAMNVSKITWNIATVFEIKKSKPQ